MRLNFTPSNHPSDISLSSDHKCKVIRFRPKQLSNHTIAKATYNHIKNRISLIYNTVCVRNHEELSRKRPVMYNNFIKGKIPEDHVFITVPVSMWYNFKETDTSDKNYLMLIIVTDNILGHIPPDILSRYVTKKDKMEYLCILDNIFINEILPRANNALPPPSRLDMSIFTTTSKALYESLYRLEKFKDVNRKEMSKKSIRSVMSSIVNMFKKDT